MTEDLLRLINSELAYIRKASEKFAQDHPSSGTRLLLGAEGSGDPHVERLIQAFALLTGRVRLKLDDELPEVTDALLNALYPHHLAPMPSMAVVQMNLKTGGTKREVPRG